ncbi:MAG: AraC family transcriptional regulator, partial [Spirochaetales bacterium]|nr:AraC family transcriptional regulator [Spirochaetales bacterium]
ELFDYFSLLSGRDIKKTQEYFSLTPLITKDMEILFGSLMKELKKSWLSDRNTVHFSSESRVVHASQFQTNLIILRIFSLIMEEVIQREAKKVIPENIESVARYMMENYDRQISIADLAEMASLSRHYFQGAFKKYYSVSPITFLNRIRIRQSMKMLESTKMGTRLIAEHVGIDNPYYFSKLFKKHVKMPPSEYRKLKTGSSASKSSHHL